MRAQYVIEPFRLLNPEAEFVFARSSRFDKQAGIGCLGTLALSGAVGAVALWVAKDNPLSDQLLDASVSLLILGTIYTLIQLALVPGRDLRNRIVPKLAQGLRPLQPTRDELSTMLDKCKTAGLLLGRKVKLDRLQAELDKVPI